MDLKLDGTTVSSIFIGVAALFAYLVSQMSAKAREDRRQLRLLTRREIAWTRWERAVKLWAARHGHDDLPDTPRVLTESEEDP